MISQSDEKEQFNFTILQGRQMPWLIGMLSQTQSHQPTNQNTGTFITFIQNFMAEAEADVAVNERLHGFQMCPGCQYSILQPNLSPEQTTFRSM